MQPESTTNNSPVKEIFNKIKAFWSNWLVLLFVIIIILLLIDIHREEVVIDLIDVPDKLPPKFTGNFSSKEGFTRELQNETEKVAKNLQDKTYYEFKATYNLDRLYKSIDNKSIDNKSIDNKELYQCKSTMKQGKFKLQCGNESGLKYAGTEDNSSTMPKLVLPQSDNERKDIDIEAQGIKLPLRELETILRKNLGKWGKPEIHITGEITTVGDNKIRLSLRSDSEYAIKLVPIEDINPDVVLHKGAKALLALISPCTITASAYNSSKLDIDDRGLLKLDYSGILDINDSGALDINHSGDLLISDSGDLAINETDFQKMMYACLHQPEEIKYYGDLLWGQIYSQQKQPEAAIDHYKVASENDNTSAEAFVNWGLALLQPKKPNDDEDEQKKPNNDEEKFQKAKEAAEEKFQNAKKAAEKKLQKTKEVDPNYLRAYFYLYGLQQDDEAKKTLLQDAVKAINNVDSKQRPVAYLWWGNALLNIYNSIDNSEPELRDDALKDALKKFNEAITLAEKMEDKKIEATALVLSGNVLLDSGKADEAIKQYSKAADLQPHYAVAFNNRGIARYGQALALAGQGNYSEATSNFDQAIRDYQKAIQEDKNYPDYYYNAGIALLNLNDEKEPKFEIANQLFKTAYELNPKSGQAAYLTGFTLWKLGNNPSEAVRYYEEANNLNFEKTAYFYDNWGRAIVSNAVSNQDEIGYLKIVEAIDKYKMAIVTNKSYDYAYYDCGLALQVLGQCDDAINLYQKVAQNSGGLKDYALAAIERAQSLKQKGLCNFQLPVPDPAAILATATAETCLNPQPNQSGNTISDQIDVSLDTKLGSQGGIIPKYLIWPLGGGLVLLTGFLVFLVVKHQRDSKASFTLDPETNASYTPPHSVEVPAQGPEPAPISKPRRYTQVGEQFPPPGPRQAPVILVGVEGTMQDRQFLVNTEVFHIGRNSGNDLVIPNDDYVSGNHASLQYKNGSLLIVDLDSTNGTFVNEIRMAKTPLVLQPGDRIRVGNTTFKVVSAP